jgi:DNA-binding transcriptional regulator PaaX
LVQRTGLSIANASQHLKQMRRAGLVTNRCEGKFIYYRLADDAVLDLLAAVRRIAERNSAEVERVIRSYFDKRDSLEAVSRDNSWSEPARARLQYSTCDRKTNLL